MTIASIVFHFVIGLAAGYGFIGALRAVENALKMRRFKKWASICGDRLPWARHFQSDSAPLPIRKHSRGRRDTAPGEGQS